MSEVILFGEPMALFIAEAFGPLEKVECFRRSLAGAEVNVCIGLTRLGHNVTYVTRLGDEPLGRYIERKLQEESIGTQFLTFDTTYKTGFILKNKVRSGDPEVAYYRKGSAASHIGVKEINAIDFTGVKLVHITGIPPALSESCRQATDRLIERARENGVFISFDPNLRPALWESREVMIHAINDLASRCDMILPGISEGLILTGSDKPEDITKFYQGLGVDRVVVKLGPEGAYVQEDRDAYMVPGYRVDEVVDTVGAGDGFAVGVISGILEELPLMESVRRGNAIGALQVTHVGDNEGLPTKKELEEFMRK